MRTILAVILLSLFLVSCGGTCVQMPPQTPPDNPRNIVKPPPDLPYLLDNSISDDDVVCIGVSDRDPFHQGYCIKVGELRAWLVTRRPI